MLNQQRKFIYLSFVHDNIKNELENTKKYTTKKFYN